MSAPPFRFVHATSLRLDQPLRDIGEVTPDVRRLAEDATLIALERIFDACVDHQVEFLLLTGNCFDRSGLSLRAQSALEDGFEQLDNHGIEVFVVPGETDPAAAWNVGLRLPANVTTFFGDHCDPVAVVREGQVIATIAPLGESDTTSDDHRGSFRIGLLPAGTHADWQSQLRTLVDGASISEILLQQRPAARPLNYLALGSGESRLSLKLAKGWAHDPGSPQSLEPGGQGPQGCSLVEVDARMELHIQLLPAAIIGWEQLDVPFDSHDNWDQLAQRMLVALRACPPRPGEKVEIIRWNAEGSGHLVDSLQDPANQQELCELIEQELVDRRGPRRVHQLTVRQAFQPLLSAGTTESLYDEFIRYVQTDLSGRLEQFRQVGPQGSWPAEPWVEPVRTAAARVQAAAVLEQAQTQGRVWLTGLPDHDQETDDTQTA